MNSYGKILSIVIPVYKVEPYIGKCLDSLILDDERLMDLLEVIIVNDGTPDRSAEMSREYVKRYPNTFRQIDKENGGHGSAWNVGLKEATGKYLRFLDSDDWLTNLGRLMTDLQNCAADVVINAFDTHFVEENKISTTSPEPVVFGAELPISKQMWGTSTKYGYNNINFWSVTYKTEILKPLYPLFAERVMYDDYILTWAALVYGRTYKAFDYTVYNYLVGRPNQSMATSQMRKRAVSYWACFKQCEQVRGKMTSVDVPSDLLEVIHSSIEGYASLIFWYMTFLPFADAKKKTSYLWNNYLKGNPSTSVLKRYSRLPFVVFYVVELLRNKIAKQ